MIEVLAAFGLSAATGLNAYLPLLIVGLLARFTDLITLSTPWNTLENPWVLGVLGVLLVIEMAADKIPAVDTVNDVIQTVIRPTAGAILFAASGNVISDMSPVLAMILWPARGRRGACREGERSTGHHGDHRWDRQPRGQCVGGCGLRGDRTYCCDFARAGCRGRSDGGCLDHLVPRAAPSQAAGVDCALVMVWRLAHNAPLRMAGALLVGVICLWLSLRGVRSTDLLSQITSFSLPLVLLAIASVVLVASAKALRWQWLYGQAAQSRPWSTHFAILMISQMLNLVIPIRLGELARLGLMRQEGRPVGHHLRHDRGREGARSAGCGIDCAAGRAARSSSSLAANRNAASAACC